MLNNYYSPTPMNINNTPMNIAPTPATLHPLPIIPFQPFNIPNSPYGENAGYPTAPPASANIDPNSHGLIPGVPTPWNLKPNILGQTQGGPSFNNGGMLGQTQGGPSFNNGGLLGGGSQPPAGQPNMNQTQNSSQNPYSGFLQMLFQSLFGGQQQQQYNPYAASQMPASQPTQNTLGPSGTQNPAYLQQMMQNPALKQMLMQIFQGQQGQ